MKDNKYRKVPVHMTRRGLLAAGALLGGAIVLPARADEGDPAIEFVDESCGVQSTGPRILVGYASMCGSTGEIAAAIGKKLCASGAKVDIRRVTEVNDLSEYDAFVIGSAIQAGMWLPEAMKFLSINQKTLAKSPVAYFIACMALSSDKEASRKLARQYIKRPLLIAPRIKPVALGMFAGKVDYSKMPKRYQPVMRKIVAEDLDARDWDKIGQWGEQSADQLIKD